MQIWIYMYTIIILVCLHVQGFMAFTFLLTLSSWCAMHMLFHVHCTAMSTSVHIHMYMKTPTPQAMINPQAQMLNSHTACRMRFSQYLAPSTTCRTGSFGCGYHMSCTCKTATVHVNVYIYICDRICENRPPCTHYQNRDSAMNDVTEVWYRSGENLEAIACIVLEIQSLEARTVG